MSEDHGLADSATPLTGRPNILLIESDAGMRVDLTRLLDGNCELDSMVDAPTAFRLALKRVPDLVLANVMTWRSDGFDFLLEFRRDARLREIPIVLYSSRAGEDSCLEGMEAG